jgi:tetratricopeptide (TPR) repeat protein
MVPTVVLRLGLAVAVLLSGAPVAVAQTETGTEPDAAHDEEGRALFTAGRVAFDDGRFEDALGYFQRAYDLSHRPQLLYNIGAASDRLRRSQQAIDAFERYLAEVPDAGNRREVEARVRLLREDAVREEREREERERRVRDGDALEDDQRDEELHARVDDLEDRDDDGGGGIWGQWWFWTIVGAAIAGGVVATLVLTADEPDPDYMRGDAGSIAFTLCVGACAQPGRSP